MTAQTPKSIYLGFLEQGGPKAMEWNGRDLKFPRVRLAFEHRENHWVAVRHDANTPAELHASPTWYPKSLNWIVVRDGQRRGTVTTRPFAPQSYGDIAIQSLESSSSLPVPSGEERGWPEIGRASCRERV